MLHAISGLLLLLFLAVTLLAISRGMIGGSVRRTRELRALNAAEASCSRGIAMLESGAVSTVPYRETNVALGRQRMDLEIVNVSSGTAGAYGTVVYEVRGTGRAGNLRRTVAVGGSHDSFLSFSRFLEMGGLSYDGGATLTGKVYAGGDLTLSDRWVTFREDVDVTGRVVNKPNGVFQKRLTEGAAPMALQSSMDPVYYRGLAQSAGLYFSSSTTPVIDLSQFDFGVSPPRYGSTVLPSNFNGVVFGEYDLAVKGVLEGRSLTLVANRDVIVNDNIRTGCTRERTGRLSPSLTFNVASSSKTTASANLTSLMSGVGNAVGVKITGSKWKRANVYVYEDSRLLGVATVERSPTATGSQVGTTVLADLQMDPVAHSYRAEIDYWSNGSGETQVLDMSVSGGDPVNVGLLAKGNVYLSQYTPRVLRIDAALLARDGNWRPLDYSDSKDTDNSHWACNGVYDLDQDGQIETNNEDGWNETNVGNNTWVLAINGPIITKNGGSAGAWAYYGGQTGKGTRLYNYDDDIVHFQPPAFPIMLSRWTVVYWREV
jgi:hypothetical protein